MKHRHHKIEKIKNKIKNKYLEIFWEYSVCGALIGVWPLKVKYLFRYRSSENTEVQLARFFCYQRVSQGISDKGEMSTTCEKLKKHILVH